MLKILSKLSIAALALFTGIITPMGRYVPVEKLDPATDALGKADSSTWKYTYVPLFGSL